MIRTLLKNLLLSVIVLSVATFVFSQTTNPPVKTNKNSPFSPNPKKKGEQTHPKVSETTQTTEKPDEVKIVKAEAILTPVNKPALTVSDDINNQEVKTETAKNFESRSVAQKTLEVVKRAGAVEVSPTEIYKIGIGDVLFISLQNAPTKESTYFTVLNDGTIDYPLAGEMVQIQGLTTDQVEDMLKEKIKLYENPQVSVKVREPNSHSYTVLGLVEKSGERYMSREAIPLFVVRTEAVVHPNANVVTIKRNGAAAQTLDLNDLKTGEVLIFPGDNLEFSESKQFYYISGEINSGGKKDFTNGITLTQAIIESGDLKKKSVRKVIIRRKNSSGLLVSAEFDLKLVKDGKAADPVLMSGDIIEVGN